MPNSLRCKIKHLRHNGTLTERECDRILKALEQQPILDKIREQIELEKLGYPPSAGYYKAIMKVLQIIDEYKAETEKEEPAEWIVDTDDSRRWDRVRFYCSACGDWNTYGKSKHCPECGRRMKYEIN